MITQHSADQEKIHGQQWQNALFKLQTLTELHKLCYKIMLPQLSNMENQIFVPKLLSVELKMALLFNMFITVTNIDVD